MSIPDQVRDRIQADALLAQNAPCLQDIVGAILEKRDEEDKRELTLYKVTVRDVLLRLRDLEHKLLEAGRTSG